jgi:hypothetical protein
VLCPKSRNEKKTEITVSTEHCISERETGGEDDGKEVRSYWMTLRKREDTVN